MAGAVELVGITKAYDGKPAVDNISLKIVSGQYCCLLGPSGCGKSTTLRMIAGHEEPSAGSILLNDREVTDLLPRQRGTAMMFQSYALFPHMSSLDNVAYGLKVAGVDKACRRQSALEMLVSVNMAEYADKLPDQLSGGQQQRVALARALICKPDVVLLDEPLSALDPFLRIQMRKELKQLQQQMGLTFIHVTHSQEEAFALADLAVVMKDGVIKQAGHPRDIFEKPLSAFVANFIGGHNVLDLGKGANGFSVRSDQIQVYPLDTEVDETERVAAKAEIVDVEFQAQFFFIEAKLLFESEENDGGQQLVMCYLAESLYDPEYIYAGSKVQVCWSKSDVNMFG